MRRFLLLPLLALAGCSLLWPGDESDDDVACTLEFAMHYVDVRLPDGSPAEDVSITATNRRTGIVYGPCDGYVETGVGCVVPHAPGRYSVYTDLQQRETSTGGDGVTVRGEQGDLAFEADFRFARGLCHVEKRAGPDTVTLR